MQNSTSANPRSARPDYVSDKMADGKERIAVKQAPSGHNVRMYTLFELSRLKRARQGVYMTKSCPSYQGYLTCRSEITRPNAYRGRQVLTLLSNLHTLWQFDLIY